MHPIEHLRAVARQRGLGHDDLVFHASSGLAGLAHDRPALLVACRQLLARNPDAGPLWWLAASAVASPDPHHAIEAAVADLDDRSALEEMLEARAVEGGAVVAVASVAGPDRALVDAGAVKSDRAMWVLIEPGRRLPEPLWRAARAACAADGLIGEGGSLVEIDLAEVDRIFEAPLRPCPAPPELTRPLR